MSKRLDVSKTHWLTRFDKVHGKFNSTPTLDVDPLVGRLIQLPHRRQLRYSTAPHLDVRHRVDHKNFLFTIARRALEPPRSLSGRRSSQIARILPSRAARS